jgi:glycosyltransferase involved in cell wall biosynthesis
MQNGNLRFAIRKFAIFFAKLFCLWEIPVTVNRNSSKKGLSMAKLSVIILTQDNEEIIRSCLESVKKADEIIVIDAFSTDKTVQICSEYSAKIYSQEWLGFSRQRNYGISKASFEWVLFCDSDEEITPELWDEIQKKINDNPKYDGYSASWRNRFLGRELNSPAWYPNYQPRLFRKQKAHYDETKEVHEGSPVRGWLGRLKGDIIHNSLPTLDSWLKKNLVYSNLEVKQMLKTHQTERNRKIKLNPKSPISILRFLFYDAIRWFGIYFVYYKGYKDGLHGLIYAILGMFHIFVVRVKYWDMFR